jgi:hypothetical protein
MSWRDFAKPFFEEEDPRNTHGPRSRRCPFVLDEERRELDRELADRREEHGSVGWWL